MNTNRDLLEAPRGNSIDVEMAVARRKRARCSSTIGTSSLSNANGTSIDIEMAVAHRKRAHCSSAIGTSTLSKHKIGYATSWKTDFPWHIPVYDESETSASDVVRLEEQLRSMDR